MGTLIGQRILGNFKLQSESENKAWLTQDAVPRKLPIPFQYGGDIAANIILAAASRLPAISNQRIMSVSIEFVTPGDYNQVRNYHVEKARESGRFVHTMVRILQGDRLIAVANATFHGPEGNEKSLHYLPRFPEDCPLPDQLQDDSEAIKKFEEDPTIESSALNYARRTVVMCHGMGNMARPCDPVVYFRLNKEPTTRMAFWLRFNEKEIEKMFEDIDHSDWSAALLAYGSDFRIMGAALRQNPTFRDGQVTTLSHSMWFSPNFECRLKSPTEWFLYDTCVIMSGNNTVLCEGHLWNEQKQLLAITKQQGLCRPKM